MEKNSDETLYTVFSNSDSILIRPSEDKYIIYCCCITEKWCFEHSGIALFKEYDETKNNCCICLDCCTWCLEFNLKKPSNCIKDTNCYLCCITIYFT
jgi:hypothetical protein